MEGNKIGNILNFPLKKLHKVFSAGDMGPLITANSKSFWERNYYKASQGRGQRGKSIAPWVQAPKRRSGRLATHAALQRETVT